MFNKLKVGVAFAVAAAIMIFSPSVTADADVKTLLPRNQTFYGFVPYAGTYIEYRISLP